VKASDAIAGGQSTFLTKIEWNCRSVFPSSAFSPTLFVGEKVAKPDEGDCNLPIFNHCHRL
jgi:hypothetical protein